MKAWQIEDATGIEALQFVDVPEPSPGPGEVVVQVKACALNYRDLMVVRGAYGKGLPSPLVPLSDGVGEVVDAGPGVTRVERGDRVAGIFMPAWTAGRRLTREATRSALGGAAQGMLAEYVVLPSEGVVHVPEHLSDEEAATLPCAGVTAWNALFGEGDLQPGQTVLLLGTGGVSIFALQFARTAGARVLITSSSDEKLARARELGAAQTINYRTTPDWEQAVYELTDRNGVDAVVEVGGAGTLPRSLRSAGYGGYVALIGVLTGVSADVPTIDVLRKNLRVQGIYVGSREHFEAMNRAVALHGIRPVVDRVFGFEDASGAYEHLAGGTHLGKVVVRVSGDDAEQTASPS